MILDDRVCCGPTGFASTHVHCQPNDRLLLVILIASILVVACGPSRASLSNETEAQLRLPGSVELSAGGTETEQTPEGRIPAISWRRYGVDASWEQVVAFFDAELRKGGWQEGGGSSGLSSTIEWAVKAWHADDRILRLGHLRNAPTPDSGSFVTFYSVALIGQGLRNGE